LKISLLDEFEKGDSMTVT